MELLEGEKKEDFYEVRENIVIIIIFDNGHHWHLRSWSLLSSLNMVMIVIFDHSHYDNLIIAVRGLRRRPGHLEVFSEPNQEGGDGHEGEEG